MQAPHDESLLPSPLECVVEGLEYFMSNDDLANTYVRLLLRVGENVPCLSGRQFPVELPPSHLGHADFIIANNRFLQSMESHFKAGDRCKVRFIFLLRCMPCEASARYCP